MCFMGIRTHVIHWLRTGTPLKQHLSLAITTSQKQQFLLFIYKLLLILRRNQALAAINSAGVFRPCLWTNG